MFVTTLYWFPVILFSEMFFFFYTLFNTLYTLPTHIQNVHALKISNIVFTLMILVIVSVGLYNKSLKIFY